MNKTICIVLSGISLLCGCRNPTINSNTAKSELRFYYSETIVPPDTYNVLKKDMVIVTKNMFTDVNNEIHERIRRKAAKAGADAVIVGEIDRTQCPCPSCRNYDNPGVGPHVVVDITLLRLKPQGTAEK